jgi:DNA-binding transcriptional regulator LsrR (DeoR family)
MPRTQKALDPAAMYKAAQLYYRQHMSQTTIATRMHVDRRDVRRLLDEAEKQGVVRIHLFQTVESWLEEAVRVRFPKLQRVLIVPGREVVTEAQCDDLFRRMGLLAADYFEELYEQHSAGTPLHVGVTGGGRLLEFASAVPIRNRPTVHVLVTALVGRGRLGEMQSHSEPNVAASILWTHCGSFPGNCEYETVEPYRTRGSVQEELRRLEKVPSIREIVEEMDKLDVVFAGFGFLNNPEATEAWENRITMGSLLKSVVDPKEFKGAVGDFCYCPFDADGNTNERWHFFLTAGHYSSSPGIDFYKRMVANGKKVVGFGGPYLLPVIKAALKAEIINVLVLDEYTATQIAEGI